MSDTADAIVILTYEENVDELKNRSSKILKILKGYEELNKKLDQAIKKIEKKKR